MRARPSLARRDPAASRATPWERPGPSLIGAEPRGEGAGEARGRRQSPGSAGRISCSPREQPATQRPVRRVVAQRRRGGPAPAAPARSPSAPIAAIRAGAVRRLWRTSLGLQARFGRSRRRTWLHGTFSLGNKFAFCSSRFQRWSRESTKSRIEQSARPRLAQHSHSPRRATMHAPRCRTRPGPVDVEQHGKDQNSCSASTAQGVYPIAPTPFTDSGEIDFASTDRMVDWWREIGATGHDHSRHHGRGAEARPGRGGRFRRALRHARAASCRCIVGVSAPGIRGDARAGARRDGRGRGRRHDRPAAVAAHRRPDRRPITRRRSKRSARTSRSSSRTIR